jgi:hypothetical protein
MTVGYSDATATTRLQAVQGLIDAPGSGGRLRLFNANMLSNIPLQFPSGSGRVCTFTTPISDPRAVASGIAVLCLSFGCE